MSAVLDTPTDVVVEAPVVVAPAVPKFGAHSAKLSDAGTCACKGCYGSRQARLANGPTVKKASKKHNSK